MFDLLILTIMNRKPKILFLLSGLVLNTGCSLNHASDVISPDGINKFVISINPDSPVSNIASFYLEVGEQKDTSSINC